MTEKIEITATIELKELKRILDYYLEEYSDEFKMRIVDAICGIDREEPKRRE